MSLSHPLPTHEVLDAMSNDMTNDDPNDLADVTSEIGADELAKLQASVLAAQSSHPPERSGVGVVGPAKLKEIGKPPRPLVPPPPRPSAKSPPSALAPEVAAARGPLPNQVEAVSRAASPGRSPIVSNKLTSNALAPTGKVESPVRSTPIAKTETSTRDVASPGVEAEDKSASPPSEKTQVFRPNLADPQLRRSGAPTAPPPPGPLPAGLALPKESRVPADIAVASERKPLTQPRSDSRRSNDPQAPDRDDRTHTYSPEAIDRLLHGEQPTVRPPASAADEVTRIGEIPIEELAARQAATSSKGVGHEDVTRVYDAPSSGTKSEGTAPGARKNALDIHAQPLVVIRPDSPKARWGRWLFLGLIVVAAAVGWTYRAPLGIQAHKLQTSFIRGVAGSRFSSTRLPTTVAAPVSISVTVSPADARIMLDGVLVTNPYSAKQPADKQTHQLVAEAPGCLPLRRSVQFERDLTVVLALAQEPQQTSAASPDRAVDVPATPAAQPAPATAAPRTARFQRKRTKAAAASDAESTAPTGSSNCTPPFTVDADGIKSYKPECL